MANIKLTIQHGNNLFEPPIEEGVEIEWERKGSPGKLTFTTLKVHPTDMSFQEGDPVCFYYNDLPVFLGYVFTKKRDREHHIKVTCYDQIRYLKNKFTYAFENKTATQITEALCKDFNLLVGNFENTKYIIPAVVEENKSALDIMLGVLDETLANTGEMYVLYDDFGKLQLKNCADMVSSTLICKDTGENFDYSSSIDDETYNQVVLYYDPNSNSTGSGSNGGTGGSGISEAQRIINKAKGEIGTSEQPKGSNYIKYNTEYYGGFVSGSAYAWCCVFVWWVFKECGLSNLFYDGGKTAWCPAAAQWFKNKGQWVTSGYQPGDVVFFHFGESDRDIEHVGIVESVNDGKVTCIEGNYSDKVDRVVRSYWQIAGAGRPAYSSSRAATSSSSGTTNSTATSAGTNDIQIFIASTQSKINEWGLLRHFEKVDTASDGQVKAQALLKLYSRKTRELKVNGAFGDINIRGGTLIPVKLDLGDVQANNFMLVEKVKHKFDNDHHTMDLTLEGAWDDGDLNDVVSKTVVIESNESNSTASNSNTGYTPSASNNTNTNTNTNTTTNTNSSKVIEYRNYPVPINVTGGLDYAGTIKVVYTLGGKQKSIENQKSTFRVYADTGTTVLVYIKPKTGYSVTIDNKTGKWTSSTTGIQTTSGVIDRVGSLTSNGTSNSISGLTLNGTVSANTSLTLRWVK